MTRSIARALGLAVAALALAAPALAQVVQSVQFGVGGFFPRGIESRSANDVLTRNRIGLPLPGDPTQSDALVFDIRNFQSGHIFAGWNVGVGPHIEFGAEAGLYGRSVVSFYRDVINDLTNGDIVQTLRLRVVPLTAMVRFLPFGDAGKVQPYVGVGVSAMHFNYSEIGSFVRPDTLDIRDERHLASGFAGGGVLLGGVRFPLRGDIYSFGVEGRYLFGQGSLPDSPTTFRTGAIDLSGGQVNVIFLIRY